MVSLLSPLGPRAALVLAVSALSALSACKNQAPPAAEATTAAAEPNSPSASGSSASAATDSATAPAPPSDSKYSEAGFELVIQPKGDYASGKAGEAEVVLSAKPPYHVNDKYPYKFKLKDEPGLTFANMVVTKDAVKFEPARATVPVLFTPTSLGKHIVSGQLSFSVCTDDKCMIEKRELALEIEAK